MNTRLDEHGVVVVGLCFAAASFLLATVPSAVVALVVAVDDALDVWGDDDD